MPLAGKTVATGFPAVRNVKDDGPTKGLNMVVFSPPGAGKTSLIATMKDYRPDEQILLFDLDVGRESIRDKDIDYVSGIDMDWPTIRGALDTALELKGDSPYRTYAWDSLSSLYYEHLFPYVEKKHASKDPRQHYFEAQKLLTTFMRDAKMLSEYGINTLFSGHEKEEVNGEVVNVRLALPQGARNEVLLCVNHVGYLNRKKNTEIRELHMAPPRRVDGPKVRTTETNRKNVPLVYEDPTIGKLLEALTKDDNG